MRSRTLLSVVLLAALLSTDIAFAATMSEAVLAKFKAEETKYQLPENVLSRIAKIESSGNAQARNPSTDAAGLFQWIPRSWYDASKQKYGAPLNLSARYNPLIATEVTALALRQSLSQNQVLFSQAGADPAVGLYMCHFLGPGGCRKFFSLLIQYKNDPRPASTWFPKEAAYNPGMFGGVTLAGLYNRVAQKMNTTGISGVTNVASAYDGPLAGRIMDSAGNTALATPFSGPVPGRAPSLTYPSTYTAADAVTQPTAPVSNTLSSTNTAVESISSLGPDAANIIAQPLMVKPGQNIVVLWTSVGMQPGSCKTSAGGSPIAIGNEATKIIPAETVGIVEIVLSCTNQSGSTIEKRASVSVQE